MPEADAYWRVAGPRPRGAVAAYILRHGDGAARYPHCPSHVVTGVDATPAPLRNLDRQEQIARIACLPGCLAASETTSYCADAMGRAARAWHLWRCSTATEGAPPCRNNILMRAGPSPPSSRIARSSP